MTSVGQGLNIILEVNCMEMSTHNYLEAIKGHNNGTVDLSIHGYTMTSLHKYQHPTTDSAEHAPHIWNRPVYGSKTQYVQETEERSESPRTTWWYSFIIQEP
jgi:hypothetical protein